MPTAPQTPSAPPPPPPPHPCPLCLSPTPNPLSLQHEPPNKVIERREERIDQELKRLKAVQEAAQYKAQAQASRKMLEHQKSIARVTVPTVVCAHFACNVVSMALAGISLVCNNSSEHELCVLRQLRKALSLSMTRPMTATRTTFHESSQEDFYKRLQSPAFFFCEMQKQDQKGSAQ